MLPRPSDLVLSRATVKFREVLLSVCAPTLSTQPITSLSDINMYAMLLLSVYASLKDTMITTNLVSGKGPFHELSVIGEESCELVALCVSRLQAGIAETPSGRHNMAVGTWCVKQVCHSWIIHGRMPSHEIGRLEKTREYEQVKIREKLKEAQSRTLLPDN